MTNCFPDHTSLYVRVEDKDSRIVYATYSSRASFAETKTRPRLVHFDDGVVKVAGGMMDTPVTQAARETARKPSVRPPNAPKDN